MAKVICELNQLGHGFVPVWYFLCRINFYNNYSPWLENIFPLQRLSNIGINIKQCDIGTLPGKLRLSLQLWHCNKISKWWRRHFLALCDWKYLLELHLAASNRKILFLKCLTQIEVYQSDHKKSLLGNDGQDNWSIYH